MTPNESTRHPCFFIQYYNGFDDTNCVWSILSTIFGCQHDLRLYLKCDYYTIVVADLNHNFWDYCILASENCAAACSHICLLPIIAWWRHQMETFSALLALCAGNSQVTGEFPSHKGQWRRALMFSLICAWMNGWVNNREAGDLRRHRAHYDVTVMGPVMLRWLSRHFVIMKNSLVYRQRLKRLL